MLPSNWIAKSEAIVEGQLDDPTFEAELEDRGVETDVKITVTGPVDAATAYEFKVWSARPLATPLVEGAFPATSLVHEFSSPLIDRAADSPVNVELRAV